MLTQEEAIARVAKGAALLDQKVPGWASAVDVGCLELSGCRACVLGQLGRTFGGSEVQRYMAMLETLNLDGYQRSRPAGPFGFDVQHDDIDCRNGDEDTQRRVAYALLQDAWISAIADRLIPADLPAPSPVAIPVER